MSDKALIIYKGKPLKKKVRLYCKKYIPLSLLLCGVRLNGKV